MGDVPRTKNNIPRPVPGREDLDIVSNKKIRKHYARKSLGNGNISCSGMVQYGRLLPCRHRGQSDAEALQKFQGAWVLVSAEMDGKQVKDETREAEQNYLCWQ